MKSLSSFNTPIKRLLSLSSFNTPIKRLLSYAKSGTNDEDGDGEWGKQAIKSLVKNLKKTGGLEDLEFALTNPNMCTKCVTIARSLDGRHLVSNKIINLYTPFCVL